MESRELSHSIVFVSRDREEGTLMKLIIIYITFYDDICNFMMIYTT